MGRVYGQRPLHPVAVPLPRRTCATDPYEVVRRTLAPGSEERYEFQTVTNRVVDKCGVLVEGLRSVLVLVPVTVSGDENPENEVRRPS